MKNQALHQTQQGRLILQILKDTITVPWSETVSSKNLLVSVTYSWSTVFAKFQSERNTSSDIKNSLWMVDSCIIICHKFSDKLIEWFRQQNSFRFWRIEGLSLRLLIFPQVSLPAEQQTGLFLSEFLQQMMSLLQVVTTNLSILINKQPTCDNDSSIWDEPYH